LYRLAAEQGFAVAQYHLGLCYEAGIGVQQDLNRALSFYKLAALQYHTRAADKVMKFQRR